MPDGRTPAGASIYVQQSRRSNSVIVSIDRWPIEDATQSQCDAVYALAVDEIKATVKPNRSVGFLAQPSIWTIPTTRARHKWLLARLIEIEQNV
jgi:hypothetical protein